MSHKKLRPFIVKVSVLGYFPLLIIYWGELLSTMYLTINPYRATHYTK